MNKQVTGIAFLPELKYFTLENNLTCVRKMSDISNRTMYTSIIKKKIE